MARNTTKLTKAGRFSQKSYTNGSVVLGSGRTPVQVVDKLRSDFFRRMANGSNPAEVLEAVANYAGFVQDARIGKSITVADEAAILEGLRGLYREIKGIGHGIMLAYGESVAPVAAPAPAAAPVPNGIYTVVMGSERRTLRLRDDWRSDAPAGSQVAQFLSGPDNTSSYTGFAFVQGTTVRTWKRYANDSTIAAALRFLLAGRENWERAGKTYAMESGNCYHCGRTLTTPESVASGIGPVCAKKIAA